MTIFRGAILAGGVLVAAGPLPEPQFVRFELTAGERVTGEMTSWNLDGFEGSFGHRSWSEVVTRDAWRLYLAVMDQNDADQWIDLGWILLAAPDGESWARRAFHRAVGLDDSSEPRIAAVRAAAAERRRVREDLDRTAGEHRLNTHTPEAVDWPADRWPPMGPDEQNLAVAEMRSDAAQILHQAGVRLSPLETDHFLVYADLPPIDAARLAIRLESVYSFLAEVVGVDRAANRFWGKAVVLYFSDPDRFRLVEAKSFSQLVDRATLGICHPVGSKVFINLTGDVGSDDFRMAVARQTVYGLMHRFGTPKRLPVWANTGLAEYVASRTAGGDPADDRRRTALAYVRGGGNMAAVFEAVWAEPRPPVEAAVGALMIELMLDQHREGLRRWIVAIKLGKDWTIALAEDYGVPRRRLMATFLQYYRVND